jgi:cellulose synthase/poly-beta-1,6-N-acetylglucosamine synthase-like glycosyltransferase
LAALDYPSSKLSIVVMDDASDAVTVDWLRKAEAEIPILSVTYQKTNRGKRLNIAQAVRSTDAEIILSVDSDCQIEPPTLRRLLRHFSRPDVAAVGGVVRALNADETWLSRMQAVKYWIGYEYLKNLEDAFEQVMCLSGCLTAYRRDVLIRLEPILLRRNFLGMDIKYGEDRFLTRKIVESGYRTRMARDAICYTKVPPRLMAWISQQLRWRRSNIVDFLGGLGHLHRLKPPVMVHYFSLGMLLFVYPIAMAHSILSAQLLTPIVIHMGVTAVFCVLYEIAKRHDHSIPNIAAVWFLPMPIMFAVNYLCLSPLAMLTLATVNWETRSTYQAPSSKALDLHQ